MLELFNSGGPLLMSILTIILIILVYCSFKHKQKLNIIGRLGLVVGVLGHLLGLYSMFEALESLESGVSPTLIASGIKVSMICLIYGVLIYIISLLIPFLGSNNGNCFTVYGGKKDLKTAPREQPGCRQVPGRYQSRGGVHSPFRGLKLL